MNKIKIALSANQKYFPGLLVTSYSIILSHNGTSILEFYILDGGIDNASYNFFESMLKKHKNIIINRIKISYSKFNDCPEWRGNKMTYIRLLLPEILCNEKYVIYSDVDIVWFSDISKIWKYRKNKAPLQGVYDAYAESDDGKWFNNHSMKYVTGKYICAGVILINLDFFRINQIAENCISFLNNHNDVNYPDQTALNYILQKNINLLPLKFNFFSLSISNKDLHKPIVIHYANDFPWLASSRIDGIVPPYYMWWYMMYAEATNMSLYKVLLKFKVLKSLLFHKILPILRFSIPRYMIFSLLVVLGKKNWLPTIRRCMGTRARLLDQL